MNQYKVFNVQSSELGNFENNYVTEFSVKKRNYFPANKKGEFYSDMDPERIKELCKQYFTRSTPILRKSKTNAKNITFVGLLKEMYDYSKVYYYVYDSDDKYYYVLEKEYELAKECIKENIDENEWETI